MKPIALLAFLLAGAMAFASEGTHIEREELAAAIADGVAQGVAAGVAEAVADLPVAEVVEIEREVPGPEREVEVFPFEQFLSVSVTGDDSDGCDIPAVTLAYEAEGEYQDVAVDGHGRAWTGGNLACKNADSADVQLHAVLDGFAVTLGYDRRAVSVQEVTEAEGRVVRYGTSIAETAALGYAFAEGPLAGATIGWNVLKEAPRIAWERDFDHGFSAEAEGQRFPSTGVYWSLRVAWSHELAAGWGVTAHVGTTHGLDNVPDGVDWHDGKAPGNPPTGSYNYGFGVERRF